MQYNIVITDESIVNEWMNEWFILHHNIQYRLSMSVWKIK